MANQIAIAPGVERIKQVDGNNKRNGSHVGTELFAMDSFGFRRLQINLLSDKIIH